MGRITFLECTRCGEHLNPSQPQTICPADGGVLFARYDLGAIRAGTPRSSLCHGPATMWRYAAVLPPVEPVSLGEGYTPLLPSRKYENVWIKDEGLNPTGSFKARGLSAAVTMARHYGLNKLAIPSAGNAAGALAAYAAAAGLEAHIFMPSDVPEANRIECQAYGADVNLVNGLISDCARIVAERKQEQGWFDVSTLKEPFRVEGKKTMGYELAEQGGWELPDAVVYPTGGGVGLIGMWKAFSEMEELGWISQRRPKMIVVQSSGCAPIVKAWNEHKAVAETWPGAATVAAGLRVPKAYGDYLILDILRRSHGTAVAVHDDELMRCVREWAAEEGMFASPEGAASLAAYQRLISEKFVTEEERVVLFNTGAGLKYSDVIAGYGYAEPRSGMRPSDRRIGGIIGPF